MTSWIHNYSSLGIEKTKETLEDIERYFLFMREKQKHTYAYPCPHWMIDMGLLLCAAGWLIIVIHFFLGKSE